MECAQSCEMMGSLKEHNLLERVSDSEKAGVCVRGV